MDGPQALNLVETPNDMLTGFLHLHHYLAYVVFLMVMLTFGMGLMTWLTQRKSTPILRRFSAISMSLAHVQVLLGLVLYYNKLTSMLANSSFGDIMGDSLMRFHAVEHILAMLVGVILITVGHIRFKNQSDDDNARHIAIFYGLGFILILSRIPWEQLI